MVKNPPAVQETWVCSLGQEDPSEKENATHSSILAWEIPRTEEPGGLQSLVCKESDTIEQIIFSLSHTHEGMCLHKHLHMNVHRNLIIIETRINPSIQEQVNGQTIMPCDKNKQTIDSCNNIDDLKTLVDANPSTVRES